MSTQYRLSDVPQTSNLALNTYLLQLHTIIRQMGGVVATEDQVVTRADLVRWGLITQEQADGR